MAWWSEQFDGRAVESGDDALGLVQHALEQLAELYGRELGRQPTTDELRYALESVLRAAGPDLFADLESRVVASVVFRTRAAPKTQKYGVGDYFAIRLSTGAFCYGRALHQGSAGMLVEIYGLRTEQAWSLPQLLERPREVVLARHVHGRLAFRSGRWKILGHRALEPDVVLPRFWLGSAFIGYQIAQGEHVTPATRAQARRLEPKIMFNPQTFEERLAERWFDGWPEVEQVNTREFGEQRARGRGPRGKA